MGILNEYGDEGRFAVKGRGSDIASQRADDLDMSALARIAEIGGGAALDLACGMGGQAKRMAAAGAKTWAVDLRDVFEKTEGVVFALGDMRRLDEVRELIGIRFDVVSFQRAVHYVRYAEAVEILTKLRNFMSESGRLFVSASGMGSELGIGYEGSSEEVSRRFFPLSDDASSKHGIEGAVCLYSEDEVKRLADEAGYSALRVYSSPFGNVKAELSPRKLD